MRKPYYLEARDTWMVWHEGRQVRLGKGISEEDAYKKFAKLQEGLSISPATPVAELLQEFFAWLQVNKAKTTVDWYEFFLTSFGKAVKKPINEVRPFDVQRWADKQFGERSDSTRHGAISAVQRVFAWAEEQGIIQRSPLAKMKKPAKNRREQIVSADQWKQILEKETYLCWIDFLTFMRETGCRVQEARLVEAKHFDPLHNRFVLPPSKAKGKKHPRVIYCNEAALEVILKRMQAFPEGPIFRNTRKKPLTKDAIKSRFKQYGNGLCATLLRHTYITEALIGGTDSVSLAVLCGHADPSMVARQYQHLAQNPEYMKSLARKVRG